jgi:NAD(P)-dependent dehydrogenase (short-subunit alcohol dehydrogenase family)
MNLKKISSLVAATLVASLICRRLASLNSFSGKVVVITGGSRGLGLALARRLAREQARLAIIARDEHELARAKSDLLRYCPVVTTWQCDIKDELVVQSTMQNIAKDFGGIDMLINNAGEIVAGPLDSMTREDFRNALDIHFWAPLSVTFAALPYLRKGCAARIVNITSFGGKLAVPHLAAYCVSKFALAGFSDALRAELASKNIFVTTVAPGLMRTGSHKNAFFKGDHQKEFTWFSLAAGNPLISMGADRAARQILSAVRQKKPQLTITLVARLAIFVQAVFPNLMAKVVKLVAGLLPQPPAYVPNETRNGWDSASRLSPSILTFLADRATEQFNGLRGRASARKL